MSVVIVGASVAGVAVADGLRAKGYGDTVTLVDAEPHLPYDKPPLSKQALASDWDPGRGLLRPAEHYSEKRIDLVLGRRATRLHSESRSVVLADGTTLTADDVVLTPGVRARRLRDEFMMPGVFAIRTAADSAAVRRALADRPRVVIVGGGFIGAETAAAAASMGLDVTVVEMLDKPFLTVFGPDVADAMAQWHTRAGVRLECGVGVAKLEGEDRVQRVVLADGRALSADLVVLGLGAEPAVDWLAGSGVELDDGIVCDQFGHTNVPGVWAGGDAASWLDPPAGRHVRVEHWTTAKEHGSAIAHNIATGVGKPGTVPKTAGPVPYFWSDQYGTRVQFLGTSIGHDQTHVVHGALDDDSFVVLYGRHGRLIGALGAAAARHLMRFRPHIEWGSRIEDLLGDQTTTAIGA